VYINNVLISGHITEREALEVATNVAEENPGDIITTIHDYQVTTIYSEPIPQGPIVEIFEGLPQVTGSIQPDSPVLLSIDWSSSPSSAWFTLPEGVVDNWTGSDFKASAEPAMDLTYESAFSPDGRGCILVKKPSGWGATGASPAEFYQSAYGLFGQHRWRKFSYRAFMQHSISPSFASEMGGGKLHYLQMQNYPIGFQIADMSGHQTCTSQSTWTHNTSTGQVSFTIETGKTIPQYSMLMASSGDQAPVSGRHTILLVLSYNSGTGAIVCEAPALPGNATNPGYTTNTTVGDGWVIGPIRGEAMTIDGAGADILNLKWENSEWTLSVANNDTNNNGNSVTVVTTTSGITINGTGRSIARWEHNFYRDASNGSNIHDVAVNGYRTVQWTGWYSTNNGDVHLTPNSPWNLVQNTNDFYMDDHDGIHMFEEVIDITQNPWVCKFYVTTQWGAQNLTKGTAGTRPGTSSVAGGEITHYHDYLLYHFEFPAPAITMTDTVDNSRTGLSLQWGSYWGNSMATCSLSAWQRIGAFDIAAAHMGVADISW